MSFNPDTFFQNMQQQRAASTPGESRKYPYRSIFIKPNSSTAQLKVRVLPDIKGNTVVFPYFTHKIQTPGSNFPATVSCGRNNKANPVCELCNAIENKKNATGVASKETVNYRAAMYALYAGSTGYDWRENGGDGLEPAVGELILITGPSGLNSKMRDVMLAVGRDHIQNLLTNANGNILTIGRDSQGKQVVVTPTYGTLDIRKSQQEFDAMLASLDTLENVILFGGYKQDDADKLHLAAMDVERSYANGIQTPSAVVPNVAQYANMAAPMAAPVVAQMAPPAQTTYVPMTASTTPVNPAGNVTVSAPYDGNVFPPAQPVQAAPKQSWQDTAVAATTSQNFAAQPPTSVTTQPALTAPNLAAQLPSMNEPTFKPSQNILVQQPISPELSAKISKYCQKEYIVDHPVCDLCLAQGECPFRKPILTITGDDLPF